MDGETAFEPALAAFCREALGEPGELAALRRLSGGANMETWSFDWGTRPCVLRRLPLGGTGTAGATLEGSIALEVQAALIEAAGRAGVTVPRVLARLAPRHGLGEGFVSERVAGESLPQRILGQPAFEAARARLLAQCARELARIHALDPRECPALDAATPAQTLAVQRRLYEELGARLPVFELVFRHLAAHAPAPVPGVVLHGDFRMGNLLVDAQGIVAVLDWELASIGDPARDLAYLCVPSWRFGHYARPVGGFGAVEDLLAAYGEHSGRAIERPRFDWWLMFGTLWWGLVCLSMGAFWRGGADRSLERAVIARRVCEVELDLLLLLEDAGVGAPRAPFAWEAPVESAGAGEIGDPELLAALGEWVAGTARPALQGHASFEARVAANALGIARRAAALGPRFAAASQARLAALGIDPERLAEGLADGSIDPAGPALWNHLRLRALERLAVDQPGYAAVAVALGRWRGAAPAGGGA